MRYKKASDKSLVAGMPRKPGMSGTLRKKTSAQITNIKANNMAQAIQASHS
jgi:hypothetical protein